MKKFNSEQRKVALLMREALVSLKGLFHDNRLRKMARAIDVAPAQNGYVIRQQLQRDHFQNRL